MPQALASLSDVPLILPNARHGMRALISHEAALAGVKLRIAVETNAMSVQKSLVMAGHGLTILPSIAIVDEVARGLLVAAPLVAPQVMRKIVLALPTSRQARAPVCIVVSALLGCIRSLVLRGAWKSATWLDSETY